MGLWIVATAAAADGDGASHDRCFGRASTAPSTRAVPADWPKIHDAPVYSRPGSTTTM